MTCYAIGLLQTVNMGSGIISYLEHIDGTLAPFGGHYIIHGGKKHMLEGELDSDLIIIEFPNMESARGWYSSTEYQGIIDFRRSNSEGQVFLIEGVDTEHRATDILAT